MRAAGAFVLGAGCSAAVLAAGFAGLLWVFPTALPVPQPLAQQPVPSAQSSSRAAPAGGIASWPEIRNGVPEVIGSTVPSAPAPARVAAPEPAPAAPPVPTPVRPPQVVAAPARLPARPAIALAEPPPVPDPVVALRRSEPPPETVPLSGAAQPDNPGQPARAAVASAPDPAALAGEDQAVPSVTPLPPRRPMLGEPGARRAASPRQRAAAAPPPEPAPAEPAAPPQPAPAPERSILGVPIPDILPSGQRVKECILEFKC
jgi:hypothetical protein